MKTCTPWTPVGRLNTGRRRVDQNLFSSLQFKICFIGRFFFFLFFVRILFLLLSLCLSLISTFSPIYWMRLKLRIFYCIFRIFRPNFISRVLGFVHFQMNVYQNVGAVIDEWCDWKNCSSDDFEVCNSNWFLMIIWLGIWQCTVWYDTYVFITSCPI